MDQRTTDFKRLDEGQSDQSDSSVSISPKFKNNQITSDVTNFNPDHSFFYKGIQLDIDFRTMFHDGTFGGVFYMEIAGIYKSRKRGETRIDTLRKLTNMAHSRDVYQEKIMQGFTSLYEDKKYEKRHKYIHPQNPLKLMWDFFIAVLSISQSILATHEMAFEIGDKLILFNVPYSLYLTMDILFMIDIFMHFFTAFNDGTVLVKRRRAIYCHYLRTGFAFDLITALPLYYYHVHLLVIKMARIVDITNFLELLQYFVLKLIVDKAKSTSAIYFLVCLMKIIQVAVIGLLTMNLLGCFIRYIAGIDGEYFNKFQLENSFTNVTYFVVTTMTTVGYGDIYPEANVEMVLTMILEIVSVIYYAYCMSDIKNFMVKYEVLIEEKDSQQMIMNNFLLRLESNAPEQMSEELSVALMNDMMTSIHSDINTLLKDHEFFLKIPFKLQQILYCELFQHMSTRYKYFFMDLPDEMKFLIWKNLSSKCFVGHSAILKDNDYSDGIYFITKGEVYVRKPGLDGHLMKLNNTTLIGEQCMLDIPLKHNYVCGQAQVETKFLDSQSYHKICNLYPEIKKRLVEFTFAREAYLLEIENQMKQEQPNGKFRKQLSFNDSIFVDLANKNDITENSSVKLENSTRLFGNSEIEIMLNSDKTSDKRTSNEKLETIRKIKSSNLERSHNEIHNVNDEECKDRKDTKEFLPENEYPELAHYYNEEEDQTKNRRSTVYKKVYKEKLGEYDPHLDPLSYKVKEDEEMDKEDESGLNSSMEVPLEFFNLDIVERYTHLKFWESRKYGDETAVDYYNGLAEVVSDLSVKSKILENKYENMKNNVLKEMEFLDKKEFERIVLYGSEVDKQL